MFSDLDEYRADNLCNVVRKLKLVLWKEYEIFTRMTSVYGDNYDERKLMRQDENEY
jgi:hypothetical protein